MVTVSTHPFYFQRFSGYNGLHSVLKHDLVEIPNWLDGELTQPGLYEGVVVHEIVTHGSNMFTVEFGYPGGQFIHREYGPGPIPFRLGSELNVRLEYDTEGYSVGRAFGQFILIDTNSEVIETFRNMTELNMYKQANNIRLSGLHITQLELIK